MVCINNTNGNRADQLDDHSIQEPHDADTFHGMLSPPPPVETITGYNTQVFHDTFRHPVFQTRIGGA